MRHRQLKRKLGVVTSHRKSMLRNLVKSLVFKKRIQTTYARAKEASKFADKMITLAKKGDLHSRRQLISTLGCSRTANSLIVQIAPKFQDRAGGYTRVLKLGTRPGDGAEKALLEFTETFELPKKKKKAKKPESKEATKAADQAAGTASEATEKESNKSEQQSETEKKGGFIGKLRNFFDKK